MRDPKEAPSWSEKCCPRVGVRGEVIVKPRRLRDVERRIAIMDRFILRSFSCCGGVYVLDVSLLLLLLLLLLMLLLLLVVENVNGLVI